MNRIHATWIGIASGALLALCLGTSIGHGQEADANATHSISGVVVEERSGAPDAIVLLFDAKSGDPVVKGTYQPLAFWSLMRERAEIAQAVTDRRGKFRFDNVPDGSYYLVAQKPIGPYKGLFELHGTVIQLLGTARDIVVPRPANEREARVALMPAGEGIVQFDQEVANSDTILFLSTAPPEFDPILGLDAMGPAFLQHLVGIHRLPLGKATVIGTAVAPLYGFAFAPDNSPGFATIEVAAEKSGLVRAPKVPFVAGWSNGRKTPPAEIADIIGFLKAHALSVSELLAIPPLSNKTFAAYEARIEELRKELARVVTLPEGKSARVGDLLAADGYIRVAENEARKAAAQQ